MFEAVIKAKESIYLEMYIFQDDMEKFNFFDLLKEKAKSGLRIRLILDSFGSFSLSKNAVLELKEAGVEILFLSYLRHRMHRKILIIDESVAFIGGVNLHQTAIFWNDLMVKVTGKLVNDITRSFAKSYINAGGKDSILRNIKKRKVQVLVNTWLVEHSPIKKNFRLKRIYRKYLNKAQHRIILVTPYFAPKRWLSATLHQAILRGVQVEVLIPKNTDFYIIDRVNYFYMYRLAKLGVLFYLEPKMNHAKLMIIDDKDGMVGSQNIDFLSFDFNSEIGVFFTDIEVVAKLSEITKKWKKNSTIFNPSTYKPEWIDYILSPFINLFSKIF